jgi:hypothetical protein
MINASLTDYDSKTKRKIVLRLNEKFSVLKEFNETIHKQGYPNQKRCYKIEHNRFLENDENEKNEPNEILEAAKHSLDRLNGNDEIIQSCLKILIRYDPSYLVRAQSKWFLKHKIFLPPRDISQICSIHSHLGTQKYGIFGKKKRYLDWMKFFEGIAGSKDFYVFPIEIWQLIKLFVY